MVRKLKGENIYFPMGPAEWLEGTFKRVSCMVVKMSCGGGMGGSSWYEIIKPTSLEFEFNNVETVHGESIILNGRYIVKVEFMDYVYVEYVTSNPNFGSGKKVLEFIVNEGVNIDLIDDYKPLDDYTIRL